MHVFLLVYSLVKTMLALAAPNASLIPVGVVAERFTTWVISAIARSRWSGVRILPRGTSFQPIIRLRARLNEAVEGGLHRHPAPGIGADGLAHWSTRLPGLTPTIRLRARLNEADAGHQNPGSAFENHPIRAPWVFSTQRAVRGWLVQNTGETATANW